MASKNIRLSELFVGTSEGSSEHSEPKRVSLRGADDASATPPSMNMNRFPRLQHRAGTFSGLSGPERDFVLGYADPDYTNSEEATEARHQPSHRRMSLSVYLPGQDGNPARLSLATGLRKRPASEAVPVDGLVGGRVGGSEFGAAGKSRSLSFIGPTMMEEKFANGEIMAQMNRYTLHFTDKDVEEDFQHEYMSHPHGIFISRIGLGLGLVIFCALMVAKMFQLNFNLQQLILLERLLIWGVMFIFPLVCVLIITFFLDRAIVVRHFQLVLSATYCLCVAAIILSSALDRSVMEISTMAPILIVIGAFAHFTRILSSYHAPSMLIILLDYIITIIIAEKQHIVLNLVVNIGFVVAAMVIFLFGAYGFEITERRNFLLEKAMASENKALRATVTELRHEKQRRRQTKRTLPVDLEAPIVKVLSVVKTLKSSPVIGHAELNLLEFVEKVLSSNGNLFNPNIGLQLKFEGQTAGLDRETREWLMKDIDGGRTNRRDRYRDDEPLTSSSIGRASPSPLTDLSHYQSKAHVHVREHSFPTDIVKLKDVLAVEKVLAKAGCADFDAIALCKLTNGKPLTILSLHLFRLHSLLSILDIKEDKLLRFLVTIEEMYREVPFHNSTHACDVLSWGHRLITDCMSVWMSDFEILSFIFACIIHDLGHPGYSAAFLAETKDRLSIVYNDISILENYHVSTAFRVMLNDIGADMNIFSQLEPHDYTLCRSIVIKLVLGTDLSNHFVLVSQFQRITAGLDGILSTENRDERNLVLQVAMKICDVNNVAKPPALYRTWTKRLMDEFYRQGDAERARGLEISPFMDVHNPNVKGCQTGFIDFICFPLFTGWCTFSGNYDMLTQLKANRKVWSAEGDDETERVLMSGGDELDVQWDNGEEGGDGDAEVGISEGDESETTPEHIVLGVEEDENE